MIVSLFERCFKVVDLKRRRSHDQLAYFYHVGRGDLRFRFDGLEVFLREDFSIVDYVCDKIFVGRLIDRLGLIWLFDFTEKLRPIDLLRLSPCPIDA